MTEVTAMIAAGTTLFGLVVVLGVSVSGFFKGRRWFNRI
jgi:hypothetical protein